MTKTNTGSIHSTENLLIMPIQTLFKQIASIQNEIHFGNNKAVMRNNIFDAFQDDDEVRDNLCELLKSQMPWNQKKAAMLQILNQNNHSQHQIQEKVKQHSYTLNSLVDFLNCVLSRFSLNTNRRWSIVELDLTEEESNFICGLPPYLDEIIAVNDNQKYPIAQLGSFDKDGLIGVSVLIFEAIAVRESGQGDNVEVWPAILGIPWSKVAFEYYFINDRHQVGDTENHRNLIRNAVDRLNLRNALDLTNGQKIWMRTFRLQIGLAKSQWLNFIQNQIPCQPPDGNTVASGLYNSDSVNHSESFKQSWDILRNYRLGRISRTDAEGVMEDSPWIKDEWIPDLLDAGQTLTIPDQQENDDDEVAEPNTLGEAKLLWINGTPYYQWSINQDALDSICPADCKQLTLTGPCGWIGLIGRRQNQPGWLRIIGPTLSDDLNFQIPVAAIEESEIGFDLSNPNLGFHLTSTSRLLQESDLVSRFGRDGQRHSSAWRKQLPRGEEFSLCVPTGVTVIGATFTIGEIQAMGMEMLHFPQGWQEQIQVTLENEVVWDSENLIAPSKRLPPYLRDFNVYLALDEIGETCVKGHLQINGITPVNIRIPQENRSFDLLKRNRAIQFGTNGRHLAELWCGSKVNLKIQALDGHNHTISRAWEVTLSNVHNMTPLFLGRNLDGAVNILSGVRPVETMSQFQAMKIKMIAKSPICGANLLQNGFSIGAVGKDTKKAPKCLGRKIPFYTETFKDNGDIISGEFLMGGVVERGIIERVVDIENDGTAFLMELTHQIEPSLTIQQDGKHHRILIFSLAEHEMENRIRTNVAEGEAAIITDGHDRSKWKIQVSGSTGNILGVAVCYGDTVLGCWTRGGNEACQNILQADDLTKDEVILLADFLRWFHFPFFDADLKDSVCTFFGNHAAAVLFRWETGKELNWNGQAISEGLAEPQWERVVCALVMETSYFLKCAITYKGLADLITSKVTQTKDRSDMIYKMLSKAPGCVSELATISTVNGVENLFTGTVGDDHPAIKQFDILFKPTIKDSNEPKSRTWYWKYRNDPESCRTEFISGLGTMDAARVSSGGTLKTLCDRDWAELRRDYAIMEIRKGSKDPLIELWLNPSSTVNAALNSGVIQAQGNHLDRGALRQLKYLMGFPAFSRLLARKILSPTLSIPAP